MAIKKTQATPTAGLASSPKPLRDMKQTHAKKLISQVNSLLAQHGFAAHVNELHFVPSGGGSLGCGNCPPPSVCKRVCFINDQGEPECEDRCVGPNDAA